VVKTMPGPHLVYGSLKTESLAVAFRRSVGQTRERALRLGIASEGKNGSVLITSPPNPVC
jgi:hypothetical protein